MMQSIILLAPTPLREQHFRRRYQELESIAFAPVDGKEIPFRRRYLDSLQIQFQRCQRLDPFFVEHRQGIFVPLTRKAKMDLAGAQVEGLCLPPFVQRQIDIAFVGPTLQFAHQGALSSTWRAGYQQLAKGEIGRKFHAFYRLQIHYGPGL
jgi:hypothetical protein